MIATLDRADAGVLGSDALEWDAAVDWRVMTEPMEQVQTDPVLEAMNYLVEGVVGSTGSSS